ncbi:retrotransposon protein, putative, Ty3-gypsy subclass [Panicum miliaceum]|uniref:Retrotransposon protein, putative, Ty3-gypsy subclass n=1 Tax=Panicum miliaceum TaxID=4540 RepID=A0A3L6SKE6_PANMI|nr:retrotransposon protein, putative, Ty3-gypsy subclass [Panicum miliaceum]
MEGGEGSSPPAKVVKTVAEGEWRSSSIREKDLLRLVAERVLQEKGVVQWRPAGTDSSPWEMTGETVLFAPFADRGLALPSFDFFRGFLGFYKIKHYHLPANFVLHISIFVHFKHFRHLFCLKPQRTSATWR